MKSTLFSWCHVCEGGGMGGHVGDQEEAMRDHVGLGGMGGHDGDGEGMGSRVGGGGGYGWPCWGRVRVRGRVWVAVLVRGQF